MLSSGPTTTASSTCPRSLTLSLTCSLRTRRTLKPLPSGPRTPWIGGTGKSFDVPKYRALMPRVAGKSSIPRHPVVQSTRMMPWLPPSKTPSLHNARPRERPASSPAADYAVVVVACIVYNALSNICFFSSNFLYLYYQQLALIPKR